MTELAAISTLLRRYEAAIYAKDAQATVACYSDDVVAYDLAPPLAIAASVACDPAYIQQWFDSWEGPVSSLAKEVTVKVGGGVAYAFTLRHMTGKKKDGQVADLWFRATATFVKKDGEWKISHIHNSVPFAMDGTDKALLELKP